jgi:Tfp pilus assembly PilM family ATPase
MISRSQRILGLDIGSSSVKGVELARTGDRYTITGYAEREISSAGTLKDAIAAVIREGRFKSKQVISSVSGRSVIVRYVNTPFMKQDELKNSMRFEADKYIPFDVNEVILDCVSLDGKPIKDSGEMRVVLVAVKKEVVNEHVRVLQEVGLFPYIIDVDCFALGNAFEMAGEAGVEAAPEPSETVAGEPAAPLGATTVGNAAAPRRKPPVESKAEGDEELVFSDEPSATGDDAGETGGAAAATTPEIKAVADTPKEKVFALVDIGAQKTNINIMQGDRSCFTREVYIGGEDMTDAVSKFLGVTPEEAEKTKRGGEKEAAVLEAVTHTLDDLANEIFLSFDYFENQFDAEIKTVYLSGGGSRLKGIQGVLSQTLAREVQLWNPIAGFDVSLGGAQATTLRENAPQLAVAVGLASRLRKV